MDINSYNTYSMLSMSEVKSSRSFEEILSKIENFKTISSIDTAKSYLKNELCVDETPGIYTLCPDCTVNLQESNEAYVINFAYKNEKIYYYYNK